MSLFVQESGTAGAASIVFLHGVGASGWMWEQQLAALSDFHCLTVDLPGHGHSNQQPWVSLTDTAQQIATLIQTRATHGQAHVVGLSLGGYVALALLEQHAAVLDRVVISGVTAAAMPNRSLLPAQLWVMSLLLKRRWFVNAQARSQPLQPDMRAAFTDNLLAMSMSAYRRIWQEAVDFRVPETLRQVNTPTLIVAGSRESAIIIQAVVTLSNRMPNAQGRLAPGLGHGWNVEAPGLFNAMLRAWLLDLPLPTQLQMPNDAASTGR